MSKSVILICANEHSNAGERDYAVALSAELESRGITDICALKIRRNEDNVFGPASHSSILPVSNKTYATLPEFSLDLAREFIAAETRRGNSVEIIGAGQSTLAELSQLAAALPTKDEKIEYAYLTHMIAGQNTVDTLAGGNIVTYTPAKREDLLNQFARIDDIRFETISAVPHTTTRSKIESDARLFLETENGIALSKIMQEGTGFVTVVLNAGFTVDTEDGGKVRIPYYASEAIEHGFALGQYMPAGTSLVLVDGGPRNALDRDAGEMVRENFIEGYDAGRHRLPPGIPPKLLYEEFKPNMDYNSINAMLAFVDHPSCKGFISNAEGYGTMDAVIQFADNEKILVGMFPFEANRRDSSGQRMKNIMKYQENGISALPWSLSGHFPTPQKTPQPKVDPVPGILDRMGIGSSMLPSPNLPSSLSFSIK